MNRQAVDALVQAAVENAQAGRGVEDDAHIELKRDWPDPDTRARQLAGAANACRGATLVYVIGVDDANGTIVTPARREPQEWYAQIRRQFDQVAPELLRVQTIFIGDGADSVQALVFSTDDFPYVVNLRDQNRRELPLRVGTGTESAHRNQIVRMFTPGARNPVMTLSECAVDAKWEDTPKTVRGSEPPDVERHLEVSIHVRAQVFVEHFGPQPCVLPVRLMRCRLRSEEWRLPIEVTVQHLGAGWFPVMQAFGDPPPPEPTPPQYGVYALNQQVIATAPGEFTIDSYIRRNAVAPDESMSNLHDLLATREELGLDLRLTTVGAEMPVRLSTDLVRTDALMSEKAHGTPHGVPVKESLGRWELPTQPEQVWDD